MIAAGQVEAPPKPENFGQNKTADSASFISTDDADLELDLTQEDLTYLRLKWGRNYRPFEYVQLEQLYNDMMASYDIQTAGHIDTLKMICKTSLKANQLLDLGDVDGALKMTRAYDTLMKSGKFTAAQNKAESGEFVDSIGEIAMMCEKHEFIPVYYTEQPEDKVDWVIKDNQNYVKKLVTEEMNLADLLDKALKDIEEDREREEDKEADEDGFEQELFADEASDTVTDEDIVKFREFEEELEKSDNLSLQEKKQEIKKEIKANEKKKKPSVVNIKKKKKGED